MKKIGKLPFPIFFVFMICCITESAGQKNGIGKHTLGAGIGAMNYMGEVSPRFNVLNYRPAGSIYYKYNFSYVTSLKTAFTIGAIHGSEKQAKDPIASARKADFGSSITDFTLSLEYNFLDLSYKNKGDVGKYSPYFTAGIGFFNYNSDASDATESSAFQPIIPIGIGLKYTVSKQWACDIEMVARKTFIDELDGVKTIQINNHNTGNPFDSDWYFYTGFTLNYTFYKVECPEKPKGRN